MTNFRVQHVFPLCRELMTSTRFWPQTGYGRFARGPVGVEGQLTLHMTDGRGYSADWCHQHCAGMTAECGHPHSIRVGELS